MLVRLWRVWLLMSSPANSPVAGSMGSCPDTLIETPSALMAWLYGPMAAGAFFVAIAVLFMVLVLSRFVCCTHRSVRTDWLPETGDAQVPLSLDVRSAPLARRLAIGCDELAVHEHEAGTFLITKASQKVCTFFGISKYTLYSYLDEAKSKNDALPLR